MKFKAMISDTSAMKDFMNVSHSISKLSKEAVLRITKDVVYFIVSNEEAGPKKPFIWCELSVPFYFTEFILAGESDVNNEIYMNFNTAMLAKSLTTLKHNARRLKIKLANKQATCLTLDIEQSTEASTNRQCLHNIPVDIISRKYWGDYEKPEFEDFHVTIEMPNLKSMKAIIEKMKIFSTSVTMSADKNGKLSLTTRTNLATIAAHFPNLSVQSFSVGQSATSIDNDVNEESCQDNVSTVIDIKKFSMFLTAMIINNCRAMCSIVQGQMMKLFLEQPGALSLQCFLTEITI